MRIIAIITFSWLLFATSQSSNAQSAEPTLQETADYIVYGLAKRSNIEYKGTHYNFATANAGDGDISARDTPVRFKEQISVGAT